MVDPQGEEMSSYLSYTQVTWHKKCTLQLAQPRGGSGALITALQKGNRQGWEIIYN